MKISVKTLLGTVLLLALLINGFLNIFAIQDLDEQLFKLRVQAPTLGSQAINFEERKQILERAHNAIVNRHREFQEYEAKFDQVVLADSQFEDVNRSQVSSIPVPTLSPERVGSKSPAFRERFRLWLPESKRYQLRVEFRNPVDLELQLVNEFKTESKLFKSDNKNLIQIPAGESVIETEWTGSAESQKVRLLIDGIVVYEAKSQMPIQLSRHFGWGQTVNAWAKVHPTCVAGINYQVEGKTDDQEVMFVRLISLDKGEANE